MFPVSVRKISRYPHGMVTLSLLFTQIVPYVSAIERVHRVDKPQPAGNSNASVIQLAYTITPTAGAHFKTERCASYVNRLLLDISII